MENDFISLFSQSVKQYPEKIALQFFSENLTYRDLDNLSNQVARIIINQNIKANSPVVLEVEKSLTSIVYLLGILKAGCYYIPVSSTIPIERLTYLLENSQARLIFLHHLKEKLNSVKNLNCFSMEKDLLKLAQTEDNGRAFTPWKANSSDPACCLYTSGSTGYPKGVLLSHDGLATFFEDVKPIMQMSDDSICLNTAPFIFDVSIIDTLFPLTLGATVHISPEILLPTNILKLIHHHRITHMSGVSSTINLLFGNSDLLTQYDISSLITVMTGAELLHQKTLTTLLAYAPSATIINGYGLTETTCLCTAFIINKDNVNNYFLYPIGKPLPGTKTKILPLNDSALDRGELLVAGGQLMLGYLNNPDANAKAFMEYEGQRYLKTGDIVSYDKDENLIFHGRNDTQVKINGYRIDLNEIKYTLLSMKMIKEAEVFTLQSAIAVVLSLTLKCIEEETIINELKLKLNDLLPKYMHPKKWIILQDLPKLSTGKTDLKKLRAAFEITA